MDDVITTNLRVKSCVIKPFHLGDKTYAGDLIEIKADGVWSSDEDAAREIEYPVSLHLHVYPGCSVVPFIGDDVTITIKRRNDFQS